MSDKEYWQRIADMLGYKLRMHAHRLYAEFERNDLSKTTLQLTGTDAEQLIKRENEVVESTLKWFASPNIMDNTIPPFGFFGFKNTNTHANDNERI